MKNIVDVADFFIYIFNLDVSEMGHSVVKFHRITVNQNYMLR